MLSPVGITSKYLQSPVFWILQISLFYVYIYLIICAYFYYCVDFVCKVTFVLSEKLCTEKVANNHIVGISLLKLSLSVRLPN